MSRHTYQPIETGKAPQLQDIILSVVKEPFSSCPALSYLDAYSETITVTAPYFDPFNPGVSTSTPVVYRINRSITTLSADVVKFRHNGDNVDMELYIDVYNYRQKEPIVADYSPEPNLPAIRPGDRYERQTYAYVYSNVQVPSSSNKVWDGRYSYCVDLEGKPIDATSRLTAVREEVKAALTSPSLAPYTVISAGGAGYTVSPPRSDPYVNNYTLALEQFIAQNYNPHGVPERPTSNYLVGDTIDVYLPAEEPNVGTGQFVYAGAEIAAVLDGFYFIRWAFVNRYEEVVKGVLSGVKDSHIVLGVEPDEDEVIDLGSEATSSSYLDLDDYSGINLSYGRSQFSDQAQSIEGIEEAGPSRYYGTNDVGVPGFYSLPGGTGGWEVGHVIQDEGISVIPRSNLNFTGSAVQIVDSSVADATNVVINLPSQGAGINLGAWDSNPTFTAGVYLNSTSVKVLLPKVSTSTRIGTILQSAEIVYDQEQSRLYFGNGASLGGVAINDASYQDLPGQALLAGPSKYYGTNTLGAPGFYSFPQTSTFIVPFRVESPAVKDYTLFVGTKSFTLNMLQAVKVLSGSVILSIQINGTPVVGLNSLIITSSSFNYQPVSARTGVSGNRVSVNVTSVTAAADLEFTLEVTYS